MATQLPKSMTVTPEVQGKQAIGRFQYASSGSGNKSQFIIDSQTGQSWMLNEGADGALFWSPVFYRDHGEEFDAVLEQLTSMINQEQEFERSSAMTRKALENLGSTMDRFQEAAQQVHKTTNGGGQ